MKVLSCRFLKDGNEVYQDVSSIVTHFATRGHILILIGNDIYNQAERFLDCDRIEVFTDTTIFVFDLEKIGGCATGVNAAFNGFNALGLFFIKLHKMGVPAAV